MNEQIQTLIANSRLAFVQGKYQEALDIAKDAIKVDPNNADAYLCAGNANMSFEKYDIAIKYYQKAVECEPENGDRYFHLGYALATNSQSAEAIAIFAKADEIGCSPEVTGQLYKILGMLCFDLKKYDDAVVNLCKAETIIGIDIEILQRKALSYGMLGKYTKGLEVANQIKLFAPSEYLGYRIAKEILLLQNRNEEAEEEIDRAERFSRPCMDFFIDKISLELAKYTQDKEKEHYRRALAYINDSLYAIKPEVQNVVDAYINAAEVYVQLEDGDMAANCLGAAENPIDSFNEGFSINKMESKENAGPIMRPSDREINRAVEEARRKYGDRQIEQMGRERERNAFRNQNTSIDHLTPIDKADEYTFEKLDNSVEPIYSQDNLDQINRLYVAAYTLKKEPEHIKLYASRLAKSPNQANQYIGKYSLIKALKEEGYEKIDEEYEDLIKFFRNQSVKDPTDLAAVSFRVQCYIDVKDFDNAEKLCSLLSDELKNPLLEEINKAKTGGTE